MPTSTSAMPSYVLPLLLVIVFINFVGIGALIPILPYTVIDQLGYSEIVMTSLLASFSLAMFIGNPILGRLSDRLGRKSVLMASLAVGAVANYSFAFTDDIMVMFAARILAGLAAGNIGVIQAMIADGSSVENRAKYMGFMGAVIGLGFVFGPALGGVLSGLGGGPLHQAPFAIAGTVTVMAFLLSAKLPASPRAPSSSEGKGARQSVASVYRLLAGPLGLFALAFFLLNLSFAQVEASFVLVLKDMLDFSANQTGWLFTYVGVVIVIVQGGLIGPAVRRFGEMRIIIGGIALLASGQFLTSAFTQGYLLVVPVIVLYLAATTIICAGFAFTNPTLTSASSKVAKSGEMGGSLGLVQGFGSLGQVIGLSAAGPLYSVGGGGLSFGAGAVICLILLGTAFAIAGVMRRVSPAAAE